MEPLCIRYNHHQSSDETSFRMTKHPINDRMPRHREQQIAVMTWKKQGLAYAVLFYHRSGTEWDFQFSIPNPSTFGLAKLAPSSSGNIWTLSIHRLFKLQFAKWTSAHVLKQWIIPLDCINILDIARHSTVQYMVLREIYLYSRTVQGQATASNYWK